MGPGCRRRSGAAHAAHWIGGFGHVLWRRKLLIARVRRVVLASTAAYVSTLRPAYEAEALVAPGDLPDQQIGRTDSQIRYG